MSRGPMILGRGAGKAMVAYLKAGCSRVAHYLLDGSEGIAARFRSDVTKGDSDNRASATFVRLADFTEDTYEKWLDGYDPETGKAKGKLREDGIRFAEWSVNFDKTFSILAAIDPEFRASLEEAMAEMAARSFTWFATKAVTREGPRGRQVEVHVDELEGAMVLHTQARGGQAYWHGHLHANARVPVGAKWLALHTVAAVRMISALNPMAQATLVSNPRLRAAIARAGFTYNPATGAIAELERFISVLSARSRQIETNLTIIEAKWRSEHPGVEPTLKEQDHWSKVAWETDRPGKVPMTLDELAASTRAELDRLGYVPPTGPAHETFEDLASFDRDEAVRLILSRLGAAHSGFSKARIRGGVEDHIARTGIVVETSVLDELAEILFTEVIGRCKRLVGTDNPGDHVDAYTTEASLETERQIMVHLQWRGERSDLAAATPGQVDPQGLDRPQLNAAMALASDAPLVVVEGVAGSGKTTLMAAARAAIEQQDSPSRFEHRQMVVVTPTKRAARIASQALAAEADSAHRLVYQYGWRWNDDGEWSRLDKRMAGRPRLAAGDLLLVDEAGMLDQDTAHALLQLAHERDLRLAFVGDRQQMAAVGRGGVLHHAVEAAENSYVELDGIYRFEDASHAARVEQMRDGIRPEEVFDALYANGQIVLHASVAELRVALARIAASDHRALVMTDANAGVSEINAIARHERRQKSSRAEGQTVITQAGEVVGVGDRIATRANRRSTEVANRDTWYVSAVNDDGSLDVRHPALGRRHLEPDYVQHKVELCYAVTTFGGQGDTVNSAHIELNSGSTARTAYVGLGRGRRENVGHMVAATVEEARDLWCLIFARDRADLGPIHAAKLAEDELALYDRDDPGPVDLDAGYAFAMADAPTPERTPDQHHDELNWWEQGKQRLAVVFGSRVSASDLPADETSEPRTLAAPYEEEEFYPDPQPVMSESATRHEHSQLSPSAPLGVNGFGR